MGGIAAAIGGLNQPLQEYGRQQRQNNLFIWQSHRQALNDALTHAEQIYQGDPNMLLKISQAKMDIANAVPGDKNQAKTFQNALDLVQPHQDVVGAIDAAKPAPPSSITSATPGNPAQLNPQAIQPATPMGSDIPLMQNPLASLIGTPKSSGDSADQSAQIGAASPQLQSAVQGLAPKPQAPPAAQPGGSPIQGGSQIQIPPVNATPQAPSAPIHIPSIGGLTGTPQFNPAGSVTSDPISALSQEFQSRMAGAHTPLQFEMMKNEYATRMAHLEAVQQKELELSLGPERMAQIQKMQEQYPGASPIMLAAAMGLPMGSMGSMMSIQPLADGTLGVVNKFDPTHVTPITGTAQRSLVAPHWGENANRDVVTTNALDVRNGIAPAVADGIVPNNQVAPIQETDAQGNKFLTDPYHVLHNQTGFASRTPQGTAQIPGAVNPAFVPTSSTVSSPGAPPVTTIHRKGGGTASNIPAIPAVGDGPAASSVSPEIQQTAEAWSKGETALPTGRLGEAVRSYAATHGLPIPTAMNAKGQSDLAPIDGLNAQIDELKRRMEGLGFDKNTNRFALTVPYENYKYGGVTPLNDLFTGLSFEKFRSGGEALKGMSSRAKEILSDAMTHAPNLDRAHGLLPDAPAAAYGKLVEMQRILNQKKAAILQDERKSGVIQPAPGTSVDDLVKKYGGH